MYGEIRDLNLIENCRINSFKFSDYTTYGIGGYAKAAYFPGNVVQAKAVFNYVKGTESRFAVLGKGSNVLASDKEYDGAVICTRKLNKIVCREHSLCCQSGVTVQQLLNFCLKNGLGGYEYLAGIPATIGGLAFMNGGVPSRHIGDDILNVTVVDGKTRKFDNKSCNFGNKHSTMRDINALILWVELSKYAVPRERSVENIKQYISARRGQPPQKSCGCVFKNPEGLSAGKLIDEAGLKGLRIGNAEVSDRHANFIVSNGATAWEVRQLIKEVQSRVYERFAVTLEEEVEYIGEFNESDS